MFQLCLPSYICTLHYYIHTSVCPYIPDHVRLGLRFKIFVRGRFRVPVIYQLGILYDLQGSR